jgi:hypothetical protein
MLSGYAVRPPWNVAGVDYHVGIPSGTTLTPWRSASAANASFNLTSGRVSCSSAGATVTINALDFSPASGVSPYIYDTNNCSWTISNSKFGCPGAYANVIADHVTLIANQFDQNGCSGSPSSFVTGNTFVLKYNWFWRGYQHVLETGGPGAIDYRFNLIDDMVPGGSASGQHENWQQLTGTSTLSADTISFNTAYQHTVGSGNGEGYQFYCNSGPCTINHPVLSNNVSIALPGVSMSYLVNGGDASHATNPVVGGTNASNYFDLRGAFGAYYLGAITSAKGWTSSGNIDLNSGATIAPG